jgi:hypothetical protein
VNYPRTVVLVGLTVVAGCAIAQDSPKKISMGGLTYFVDVNYTRLSAVAGGSLAPGAHAIYSVDGVFLDLVTIISGAPDGKPLDRLRDQKLDGSSTPFKASMSPDEVAGLYEEMLVRNRSITSFQRSASTPITFAGAPGFTYGFSMKRSDLEIKGLAYGAVVKERLYLVTYTAPAMYIFDKNLPAAQEMVRTAVIER